MINPPDKAEFVLIPVKWLPLLQEIARGPFLPFNYPIPIIVSKIVPDDQVWFGMTTDDGNYEILTKEVIDASKAINLITDHRADGNDNGQLRLGDSSEGDEKLPARPGGLPRC